MTDALSPRVARTVSSPAAGRAKRMQPTCLTAGRPPTAPRSEWSRACVASLGEVHLPVAHPASQRQGLSVVPCLLCRLARNPAVARVKLANNSAIRYYLRMIKSFRDKETEKVFQRQFSKRLQPNLHRMAWRKLVQIDASERLDDLRVPPGNRLEKLVGDREGQYSIRVNDQWRICFEWHDGDAYAVEITDYH